MKAAAPHASIIEAMDDPALFAPHFRGGSWDAWRSYAKALFALAPTEADLAWYRAHTARQEWPGLAFKESAVVVGRRGGKSRFLALVGVFLATFKDYTDYLAPGEVATVAIIAADRKQARSIFRYTIGLLRAVPMLASMIEAETADSIVLSNRVVIEIGTASFRATRGYSYAAVLCDEIAFWRSEDSANPDVEIIAALRPGMATIPSAVLIIASSPYRKRGVLWNTFTRHYGVEASRVLVCRAASLDMNPNLDPQIVAEAMEEDPENASAEYLAQFRDDLTDFVPRPVIDACIVPSRFENAPIGGHRYYAFVDPSGGTGSDSMTIAIAHKEGERVVLDAVREQRPPFSPEACTTEFAQLLKTYGIKTVQGDRYAGEWPRERFRVHGIDYTLSEQPKSDLYRDVLPILNSGRAELLNLPRIASQFCGLERRTSRSGRDSIDHAPGGHDDVANVVAGVLILANAGSRIMPARSIRIYHMGR